MGVVPFIGAGLCVPSGMPQWSALLVDLAAQCDLGPYIAQLIREGQFEEAASAIEKALSPDGFTAPKNGRWSASCATPSSMTSGLEPMKSAGS